MRNILAISMTAIALAAAPVTAFAQSGGSSSGGSSSSGSASSGGAGSGSASGGVSGTGTSGGGMSGSSSSGGSDPSSPSGLRSLGSPSNVPTTGTVGRSTRRLPNSSADQSSSGRAGAQNGERERSGASENSADDPSLNQGIMGGQTAPKPLGQ